MDCVTVVSTKKLISICCIPTVSFTIISLNFSPVLMPFSSFSSLKLDVTLEEGTITARVLAEISPSFPWPSLGPGKTWRYGLLCHNCNR